MKFIPIKIQNETEFNATIIEQKFYLVHDFVCPL